MNRRLQSGPPRRPGAAHSRAAFTLLEMMVAASALVLIVFSLYQMFNQTQRAFRSGVTQVDVNEGGRAAMEMVTREFEQSAASLVQDVCNVFVMTTWAVDPNRVLNVTNTVDNSVITLVLNDLFCLQEREGYLRGIGFFVAEQSQSTNDVRLLKAGVGSLYRFAATNHFIPAGGNLRPSQVAIATNNAMLTDFLVAPTNSPRVIDGVLHFKMTPLDERGGVLPFTDFPAPVRNVLNSRPLTAPPASAANLVIYSETANNLPAYLEFELAVIEPAVLEVIKARIEGLSQAQALTRIQAILGTQANRVHIFRQRIAIRSVPR